MFPTATTGFPSSGPALNRGRSPRVWPCTGARHRSPDQRLHAPRRQHGCRSTRPRRRDATAASPKRLEEMVRRDQKTPCPKSAGQRVVRTAFGRGAVRVEAPGPCLPAVQHAVCRNAKTGTVPRRSIRCRRRPASVAASARGHRPAQDAVRTPDAPARPPSNHAVMLPRHLDSGNSGISRPRLTVDHGELTRPRKARRRCRCMPAPRPALRWARGSCRVR